MDFDSWITSLREVLQEPDSSLTLRNGHWEIVDRIALWDALATRVFDTHLDQVRDCSIEVLKELDPQFELPIEERFAASIHGKVLKHSTDLRKGIAETLALLGNYGKKLSNCSQHKAETTAILTIREIFENADWRLWGSLNYLLPTLAEAAPSEFLSSVEVALQQRPCPFDELFAQEGSGFGGRNYMTGLLWALERLAWSEERLARVAVILAELVTHDPGGSWANRPINSLTTILLPWYPQTLAPIDKRIAAIKAVKTEFPEVAWKVLLTLLPNQQQTTSGTNKPRWRTIVAEDWKPTVTNEEYRAQIHGYSEFAVEMACKDLDKLKELVHKLHNLPEPSFNAVLEHLSVLAKDNLSENQRLPIWISLTDYARKHRRYADAKWALGSDLVSKIEALAARIAPTSPEALYCRLFSNRDFDLYDENGNWSEQHKKLDEKRQIAVQEILNVKGLTGVIAFVDTVESVNQVGWALGVIGNKDIDADLLPAYLDVQNIKYKQFIGGFVWGRYQQEKWEWVDGLNRAGWTLSQSCQLLLYLPFEVETWHRASEWLAEFEKNYWQSVPVNPYQSVSDLLPAIDKLLESERPKAALDCLYCRWHSTKILDRERVVCALLNTVSSKEQASDIDSYHITELITALQNDPETAQEDLFNIEWVYLSLLERDYNKAEPKLLEKRLATQPDFFCEVIQLVFRSKYQDKGDASPDKQKEAIAMNAWRLLQQWRRPPGLSDDGSFSEENFQAWLTAVKEQCTKSGHLEVAMSSVGKVLFYCPPDSQGFWIVQTVANALNARDGDDLRRGFSNEIFNSRGVHWIDPTGKPERELAAQWRERADALEKKGFPRFAATLREQAESYDREAERVIATHKAEIEEKDTADVSDDQDQE